MKFSPHMHASLQSLILFTGLENPESEDQFDEYSLGVGAMMPQELPNSMFLAEPESYGI